MWIQVTHPEFFGGIWPTAPDPAISATSPPALISPEIGHQIFTSPTMTLPRMFGQTIKDLVGKGAFTYVEGGSHFDLYQAGLSQPNCTRNVRCGPAS
jgi:hypothetical protein